MLVKREPRVQPGIDGQTIKRAADLLSQQIWCWGQDILRPEGNWLIEVGFRRIASPADRDTCPSVYTLELPGGRRVVLRGFGVFYGDDRLGGVFLQRYEFQPRYTEQPTLERPPWSSADLPDFKTPTGSQHDRWTALTIALIDWVTAYEEGITERLGPAYRQATLDRWTTPKRPTIAAAEMASAWRSLRLAIAEASRALA